MPTSSVSVKLAMPRLTCARTVRPEGVRTVAVFTPCSTGSRIGWPACSCRLDWSSPTGLSHLSPLERMSGNATRNGKSVRKRSKPKKSALRSRSSSA